MPYRDLLFKLAGRITLLKIDGFIDAQEYEVLIKLIQKELQGPEPNIVDRD